MDATLLFREKDTETSGQQVMGHLISLRWLIEEFNRALNGEPCLYFIVETKDRACDVYSYERLGYLPMISITLYPNLKNLT